MEMVTVPNNITDSTGTGAPCFAATDFKNAAANDNAPWTQDQVAA